jgi:hypothetical protein
MGKGERSRAKAKAQNFRSRQKEDRGGTAGEVGEDTGGEEIGCLEASGACREYGDRVCGGGFERFKPLWAQLGRRKQVPR